MRGHNGTLRCSCSLKQAALSMPSSWGTGMYVYRYVYLRLYWQRCKVICVTLQPFPNTIFQFLSITFSVLALRSRISQASVRRPKLLIHYQYRCVYPYACTVCSWTCTCVILPVPVPVFVRVVRFLFCVPLRQQASKHVRTFGTTQHRRDLLLWQSGRTGD